MRLKTTLFLFITLLYLGQVEAQCDGADFEERNGIALIELDSKVSGSWRKESISGASGGQALTYRGTNYFNSPGNSIITYKVKINSAGTYRFAWRNKISIITTGPHPANTEHNDSWLKIQAADFYGQRGSSRVYPGGSGKTPVAAGATSGGWFKVFTNVVNWSWVAKTNDGGGHDIYARFSSPGVYNIQISGRSKGHTVDRMVLYKESSYSASQAQSLSRSVTTCSGGTPPPPPPSENVAPTVNITSPSNGQTFDAGSNITVNLSASDSDGSIQKHEIFVNNSRVDTDGSSYTAYTISNAAAGSYSIKATVTDNGGKTASSTVNISVGGSTPPPPPPSENVAPTVSITSPSNGQSVNTGSNVSIGLSASDSDGSIVKHEIFVNGTKVDTDGAFYTPHIISNITAGSYAIKATVTDDGGKTASSTVNITAGGDTPPPPPPPSGNAAPTVSFTNLSEGDQVDVGSTVSVGVSASDSDGSIVKYQVFVNGLLVDTDGSNYTPHPIRNIASGAYAIKVTVTDNQGATGSSTVNITAGGDTPPPPTASDITFDLINAATNTSIGALVDGATISSSKTQGVNIRVNAPADSKRVGIELYRNGTAVKIGFESFAPYAVFGDRAGNYFAANLESGSYTLTAAGYSSTDNINDVIARSTIKFTVGSASGKSAFLFPNPVQTDGKVSVRLPEGSSGQFKYSVTNSLGVQVEQGSFDASSSRRDVQLSLPNIGRQVQGVYYMTLSSNGSRETIPLIRE